MLIAFKSKISAARDVVSDIVDTFGIPYIGSNDTEDLYQSMNLSLEVDFHNVFDKLSV